jgi:hypothetical protein
MGNKQNAGKVLSDADYKLLSKHTNMAKKTKLIHFILCLIKIAQIVA